MLVLANRTAVDALRENTVWLKVCPPAPFWRFIWHPFIICFSIVIVVLCSPTLPFASNHFVSADSLFVLLLLFDSCQISSHRLVKPPESVVVGAVVPHFPETIDTTICDCSFDLVDLPLMLEYHSVVLGGLPFILTPLTRFCPSFVFVSIMVATPSGSLPLEHWHLMCLSGLVHTRHLPWPHRGTSQPHDLSSNHIHQLQAKVSKLELGSAKSSCLL